MAAPESPLPPACPAPPSHSHPALAGPSEPRRVLYGHSCGFFDG